MMEQLQHLGLLAAYAWLPLAFLSIDEAEQKRDWRPLWKLALASAMCLLGGYPPIWIVFAVCSAAYAFAPRGGMRPGADAGMHRAPTPECTRVSTPERAWESAPVRRESAPARARLSAPECTQYRHGVRLGLWTSAALACSLLFCAVELLPALEAARLKVPEVKYSFTSGFKHPEYYLSYFIPNYFKFDLGVDPATTAFRDYLYLGGACLCGLALLVAAEISGRGFAAVGAAGVAAVPGKSQGTAVDGRSAYSVSAGDGGLGFSSRGFRRAGGIGGIWVSISDSGDDCEGGAVERAMIGARHCIRRGMGRSPDRVMEWPRSGLGREIGMGRDCRDHSLRRDSFTCTREPKVRFRSTVAAG